MNYSQTVRLYELRQRAAARYIMARIDTTFADSADILRSHFPAWIVSGVKRYPLPD